MCMDSSHLVDRGAMCMDNSHLVDRGVRAHNSQMLSRSLLDHFTDVLHLLLHDRLHNGLYMLHRLDSDRLVYRDVHIMRDRNVAWLFHMTRNRTGHTNFDRYWLIDMHWDSNRLWDIDNTLHGTRDLYRTSNMARHGVVHVNGNGDVHDTLERLIHWYRNVIRNLTLFNYRHGVGTLDTNLALYGDVNDLFNRDFANLFDRLDLDLRDIDLSNHGLVDNLDSWNFTDNFLHLWYVHNFFDGLHLRHLNNLVLVLNFDTRYFSNNLLNFDLGYMSNNFLHLNNFLNPLLDLHLGDLNDSLNCLHFDPRNFANNFLNLNLWDVSLHGLNLWNLNDAVTDLHRLYDWHVLHNILRDRLVVHDGRLHVMLTLK